jgi:hypothetical protein
VGGRYSKALASIFLILLLSFSIVSISPNSAFAQERDAKLVPESNNRPGYTGQQNSGTSQLPPDYPPGLERAGFTRVISSVTSEGDISDIKQKGCSVINRLNEATSFFCPSELVDTMDNVRPVKMYQLQDKLQDEQIGADLVWDMGFDGGPNQSQWPISVAVLDTGVQDNHIELDGKVFNTQDFTNDIFPDGDWKDYGGHGTHVSAIIAGKGVNTLGNPLNQAKGVAPGVDLMVGKVCTILSGCPEDAIIGGLEYAAGQAEVINMSLGGGLSSEENCDNDGDPIVTKVNELAAAGTVIVIASGNDGSSNAISYPGCASGVIAVGAVDINDNIASFSNQGPAVDIVAPGVHTMSAWSCNDFSASLDCNSNWYYYADGTSMATPHVAGVVALILDKNPTWTVDQVKEALYNTAIDLPGTGDGNGRVDAYAAVNYQPVPEEDTTAPEINANPISDPFELTLTDQYSESCTATDDDPSYVDNCNVLSGGIDTSILGAQSVTYTADADPSGNTPTDVVISSNIQDTTKPVISLVGSSTINLVKNVDSYTEYGANVTDNNKDTMNNADVNGDTVDTTILGTYIVEYDASDPSSNVANMVARTVNVVAGDAPVITITGNNPESVIVGDPYSDAGATANDTEDGDLTGSIIVTNNVDTSTIGSYIVDYDVTDASGNTASESRTVNVVQDTPPVLTILGDNPMTLELNIDTYSEEGATAIDSEDGDISANIITSGTVVESIIGTYLVSYEITDSSQNTVSGIRTVDVVDTTLPVITLIGDAVMSLTVGDTYNEPGATVSDNDSATPAATISGDIVDTYTAGTYLVTYDVSDPSGNAADTVKRTVNVGGVPGTLHIADLVSEASGKKNWNAKVTITIHGNNHELVNGAFVLGTWLDESGTPIGAGDCTTDSSGQCMVNLSTKGTELTYSVSDVYADEYDSYNSADNEVSDSITMANNGGSGGDSGGGGPDCTQRPDHPKCVSQSNKSS